MLRSFVLLLAVLFSLPASAAVKFQVRGTQLNAFYASAWNYYGTMSSSGRSVAFVEANAASGVFGSSHINLQASSTAAGARGISYVGLDNFTSGANFTLLLRMIPTWTGSPASTHAVMAMFNAAGDSSDGIYMRADTAGKITLVFRDAGGNFSSCQSAAVGWVSGTPVDIWVTSNGTAGSGNTKIWIAQNGASPTSTNCSMGAQSSHQLSNVSSITFARGPFEFGVWNLNEFVIWDTVEDPTTYGTAGVRSAFITPPDTSGSFQGYAQSDPGVANVRSGTTYTSSGASKTGTAAIPAASVVLSGNAVDATTGTYVAVPTGSVKIGVTFGAASALTGTYDGSDRWTCPSAANLLTVASALKCNSTSTNLSGTYDASNITVGNVKHGVTFGVALGSTGTYRGYDLFDSLIAGQIKTGVSVNVDGSTVTGSYNGSDRWTCPLASQLSSGVQLQCNSLTANLTGTRTTVTNFMQNASMAGQKLEATMTAE